MTLLALNQPPRAEARYTLSQTVWLAVGLTALMGLAMMFGQDVWAATGGGVTGGTGSGSDILQSVYDMLVGATTGSVGKVLTLLLVIVGIGAGILRQSVMAFAVGVGAGIGLYFAPTVIDAVFSAVVVPGVPGLGV